MEPPKKTKNGHRVVAVPGGVNSPPDSVICFNSMRFDVPCSYFSVNYFSKKENLDMFSVHLYGRARNKWTYQREMLRSI